MKFTGTVCEATLSPGSKSERRVVALKITGQVEETGEDAPIVGREYQLRRTGANPFEIDPVLSKLIGQEITITGMFVGGRQIWIEQYISATWPESST
jgi:hypothetical protein